jgi:hypothetical protein
MRQSSRSRLRRLSLSTVTLYRRRGGKKKRGEEEEDDDELMGRKDIRKCP